MTKQIELSISYSLGVKANIGNYESTDAHVSRSEKWDVSDLIEEEIDALFAERYAELKEELDQKITAEYLEMKDK